MTKKTDLPKIQLSLSNEKSFVNLIDDKKRIVKFFGSGSAFNSTFNPLFLKVEQKCHL